MSTLGLPATVTVPALVELPVTAFHPYLKPSVGFNQSNEFADLH